MLKDLPPGHEHFDQGRSRGDRPTRRAPRARRLNLSDVDWYAKQDVGIGAVSKGHRVPKADTLHPPDLRECTQEARLMEHPC